VGESKVATAGEHGGRLRDGSRDPDTVMSAEYETERSLDRDVIADVFESFADELRGDDELTLAVGSEYVRINPPESCEFEVEVEEKTARVSGRPSGASSSRSSGRDAERNLVE
jgi:amphi-Trp domain-containing protein